jgi:hypothetical protein
MNETTETGIQKVGFGETSLTTSSGTMSEMLAARAKAEIQACYVMAIERPRNVNQVRKDLLDAVQRPGFAGLDAKKSESGEAWYKIPLGGGATIQGFSIRFAEEAMRCMGNMDADTVVIWEGELQRMLEVRVIDFESNIRHKTTIVVEKTVERSFLKDDEIAISQRTNSQGNTVYTRKTTEDELMKKQNSAVSKAIRNGVLRVLPGDIQAACKQKILDIRHGEVAEDPKAFLRQTLDSFSQIGVQPKALADWLGQELESCSPAQLADLRDMYRAIRDGQTTWAEILREKANRDTGKDEEHQPGLKGATQRMKKKREGKEQPMVKGDPRLSLLETARRRFPGDKWKKQLDGRIQIEGYMSFDELTDDQALGLISVMESELADGNYLNKK